MVALYSVYTGTNMLVVVCKFDTLKAPSIRCLSRFAGWHNSLLLAQDVHNHLRQLLNYKLYKARNKSSSFFLEILSRLRTRVYATLAAYPSGFPLQPPPSSSVWWSTFAPDDNGGCGHHHHPHLRDNEAIVTSPCNTKLCQLRESLSGTELTDIIPTHSNRQDYIHNYSSNIFINSGHLTQ